MVSDVLLGCAMPEGEQGMNVARLIVFAAGFPTSVPAATINRFCSSGSQTIGMAADIIRSGNGDIVIAGGVESMSMVAMGGNKPIAYPGLMETMPNSYAAMGTTAEVVARRFGMRYEFHPAGAKMRALIAVSRQSHCINALLHHWWDGHLPIEITGVVSNHDDQRDLAEWYGLPYHHLPIEPSKKPQQEARVHGLRAPRSASPRGAAGTPPAAQPFPARRRRPAPLPRR